MRIIELILGVGIVWIVLNDVFSTVIVPRPTPSRFRPAALLTRFGWRAWRARFGSVTSPQLRERRMGVFAPVVVMALLSVWIIMLIAGYGLMFDAVADSLRPVPESLGTSLYFAAVSLLTIGYGDYVATDGLARVLAIAAAANGLGIVALTITYLFSLYANLQRREVLVATLDARAGSPPSGVRLLERAGELDMRADLDRIFQRWEEWSAEMLESHVAYPILLFFRSSHDNESWISALGAILDATTLVKTTVLDVPSGQAQVTGAIGAHVVEDLSRFLRLPRDPAVGIDQVEFEAARERLRAAGFGLRPHEQSWRDFQVVRAAYAGDLNGLATFFAVPPALWIGDRANVSHPAAPGSDPESSAPAG